MTRDELKTILDTLPEPILVVSPEREIIIANRTAIPLFGDRIEGQNFINVVRNPECIRCLDEVLAGSTRAEASYSVEVPVRTTWRISAERLQNSREFEEAVIVSFSDISHVLEAEQMRSDFVANVSHELRSPLTALNGFIETLQGPAKDDAETRERFLEIMGREAQRMNRLIGDLLSLSRVEVNEHIRPTDSVNLYAIIERVIAQLQPMLDKAGGTVDLEKPEFSTTIAGDEDQLVQVFQNLIENAVKYGDSDQPVKISLTREERMPGLRGPGISIAVRDFGEGISMEHVVRLTERFYRVDDHRSREKGGTGLGLAIVKHIINRHRGRLNITSTEGKGSTFTVTLPIQ